MTHAISDFYQPCPICNRRLLVPAEFLAQRVVCGHCGGRFWAGGLAGTRGGVRKPTLLERAEALLATVNARRSHSRFQSSGEISC